MVKSINLGFLGYPNYKIDENCDVWSNYTSHGQSRNEWRRLKIRKYKDDYYAVTLSKYGKARRFGIHRLILLAFVGPCPEGMQACHNNGNKFDNRIENLRWDTCKENMNDRTKHGTNAALKLTEDQVLEIRRMYATKDHTWESLAEKFGVSSALIGCIVRNKNWKHIDGPISLEGDGIFRRAKGEKHHCSKLTSDKVKLIREMYATKKYEQKELADKFGVTSGAISAIITKRTWNHVK